MNVDVIDKQRDVVIAIARSVPEGWEQIAASYEVEDQPDTRVQNSVVAYVWQDGGSYKSGSVEDIPDSVDAAFWALNEAMADPERGRWSTGNVTIKADGSYDFKFSYDPPKRINGVWDDESFGKYNDYAAFYTASITSDKAA
jgi:hypothetical protein